MIYAPHALRIRTKDGKVLPFELNKAQKYLHERLEEQIQETGKVRALILKGRQQGCSTYTEARYYWKATHRKGVRVFILTHRDDATRNLYKMAQRYHEHCPEHLKPSTGTSNAKELIFDRLESSYGVGTAKAEGVGRSDTIQYFHGSEVAYWQRADTHATGVMQAIPDAEDTEIILESTANGMGNYFHQQWQIAESRESEYIAIFIPWYWQDEYAKTPAKGFTLNESERDYKKLYKLTDEQMAWRRAKVQQLSANGADGEWRFKQEYPANSIEAFQVSGEDSLIKPEPILKARKATIDNPGNAVVCGVDPARFGDDRTSIIMRRGRQAFNLHSYENLDTMQLVGRLSKLLDEGTLVSGKYRKIEKMFIDIGSMGAGIYDRLRELGYSQVIGVNFGEKANNPERYANRRAEMWGELANWLKDPGGVDIPDSDTLHADLTGPHYDYDSNGRLRLEKKEDMKKRGIRSPDEGDALALTFAMPVSAKARKPIKPNVKWIV